jgi:hypothetical protein
MPVARALLSSTDRAFNVVTSQNIFSNLFKRFVIPPLLKYIWKKDKMRPEIFKGVYRKSVSVTAIAKLTCT